MGATLGAHGFWLLWKSSLLWAVPVAYVVCVFGTVAAFVIAMIRDGYADALDDYVNVVGAGNSRAQSSSSAPASSQYRCSVWSSRTFGMRVGASSETSVIPVAASVVAFLARTVEAIARTTYQRVVVAPA